MDRAETWQKVEDMMFEYQRRLYRDLETRYDAWSVDLTQREVHEVVGALLGRQVTLGMQLARSPGIWNGHVAPLILRTMVDTFITLAWIVQDPLVRARQFILHGVGQQKLNIEHRATQLEESGLDPETDPVIEHERRWLDSQRFSFLTEINLGSWSGISTREMAEQAGCLPLYRYAYTPFSAATHSMWHHVARYNLVPCKSPLHRHHSLPWIAPDDPDLDYAYRGAKYVEKAFKEFEQAFGLETPGDTAFGFLEAAIDEVAAEADQVDGADAGEEGDDRESLE